MRLDLNREARLWCGQGGPLVFLFDTYGTEDARRAIAPYNHTESDTHRSTQQTALSNINLRYLHIFRRFSFIRPYGSQICFLYEYYSLYFISTNFGLLYLYSLFISFLLSFLALVFAGFLSHLCLILYFQLSLKHL